MTGHHHHEEIVMALPISTPNAPAALGPYSQAVRAGDTVYLSGQIPLDPKTGELVEGLAEATAGWEVVVAEERWRQVTGPDGREGRRADAVVCLRRPEFPAS